MLLDLSVWDVAVRDDQHIDVVSINVMSGGHGLLHVDDGLHHLVGLSSIKNIASSPWAMHLVSRHCGPRKLAYSAV